MWVLNQYFLYPCLFLNDHKFDDFLGILFFSKKKIEQKEKKPNSITYEMKKLSLYSLKIILEILLNDIYIKHSAEYGKINV